MEVKVDLVSEPNLIFGIKRSKNLNLPMDLALNMLSVLFGWIDGN
jgi:hypothetical protein